MKIKGVKYLLIFIFFHFSTQVLVKAQEHLIPLPIDMQLGEASLDLTKGVILQKTNSSLENEYSLAQEILDDWQVNSVSGKAGDLPLMLLTIEPKPSVERPVDAYHLTVDKSGIRITASSAAGIFYGLQTLRQFDVQNKKIRTANIKDKSAFSWRAFMVDVGRNYQPIDMLKEQIDVMARYKLNVLHFHFTEDIAWRLASKKYPGLTAADNMTRWKGKYYTEEQFQELIDYCKERHILFLPEIDMPGHSAAFERFFGVSMQSDSGMMYIKELLKEFSDTYRDLPYLHIGGDEVKITNKNFMPEITNYVESLGYKTVGWDPGSNLMPQTKRQLWMGGPEKIEEGGETVFIDSKHLYINHMDPLETVTTLFHRKIGEQGHEHANLIGATLCSWPDRAVAKPIDMFNQNAIYPSLLTFAERIWRGGGKSGWTANLLPKGTAHYRAFTNFEERLLEHKYTYFENKAFPYVQQVDLEWELIGPFENAGDLSRAFSPEQDPYSDDHEIKKTVEGGTVILRHWWADVISGVIDEPKENTTWYARTKIWSDEDASKPFWVGFNNLSRSYASDSPEKGTWDNRNSTVLVNGNIIPPPDWKQAGIKGNLETPLVDEGYSYRAPTMIRLKKGWNEVLIKLPVHDFTGRTWDNPIKWMFTFVPYR